MDIRQEVIETLELILAADWRKWEELASPDEFVRWAKSRANYALSIINEAPQPAEPTRDSLPRHVAQTLADAIYKAAQKIGIVNGDHSTLSVPQCLHLLECMSQPAEPSGAPTLHNADSGAQNGIQATQSDELALDKYQPCGCVICTCEDEVQCQGCGARHCGRHPIGELSGPAYVSAEPESVTKRWQDGDDSNMVSRVEAPAEPVKALSDAEIREVFLANGFTIKDGHDDLKPYVYDAARALLALCGQRTSPAEPSDEMEAMEAVMGSIDPATWPGLTAAQRCALGRFAKPQAAEPSADRQMLLDPMAAFDSETWQCPNCGHAEDTATMDSAYMLRKYLQRSRDE